MFHSSRDFFLAWDLLARHSASDEVQRGTKGPTPLQARATCLALALELALKCRIAIEGSTPKREHRHAILFGQLSNTAQAELACSLARSVDDVVALLGTFDRASGRERVPQGQRTQQPPKSTFETWRYLHEYDEADFSEGEMLKVVRALDEVILRVQPTWNFWPGVVGERTT